MSLTDLEIKQHTAPLRAELDRQRERVAECRKRAESAEAKLAELTAAVEVMDAETVPREQHEALMRAAVERAVKATIEACAEESEDYIEDSDLCRGGCRDEVSAVGIQVRRIDPAPIVARVLGEALRHCTKCGAARVLGGEK